LELVAEALPEAQTGDDELGERRERGERDEAPAREGHAAAPDDTTAADRLLDQLAAGPRAVRDLSAPEGRGALIRRLRTLERDGRVSLEWTLSGATGGPRFERWVRINDLGRAALAGGPTGRPLGPRQAQLLAELAEHGQRLAADLADRHGASALPGLARRGLVEVEIRQRERLALAHRPPGARGARPPGSTLLPEQAAAVELVKAAIRDRDATPLL